MISVSELRTSALLSSWHFNIKMLFKSTSSASELAQLLTTKTLMGNIFRRFPYIKAPLIMGPISAYCMVSWQLCDNIKLNTQNIWGRQGLWVRFTRRDHQSDKFEWPEFFYSTVAMIPKYTIGRNGSHDGWAFYGIGLISILVSVCNTCFQKIMKNHHAQSWKIQKSWKI